MQKLFVFDLDDTLMDNVHDYSEPILDATRLIVQRLGRRAPHVTKIISLIQEIDEKRVHEINPVTGEKYLYSMERFPGSLVETYCSICRKAGIDPDTSIQQDLYEIGLSAFDENRYRANIRPDTWFVLDAIEKSGDKAVLVTKGDTRIQKRKVLTLEDEGIVSFSEVHIVDRKTPELFADIADRHPEHELFSVGNSYDSDIVPALEASDRYFGLFLPVETWDLFGKMDELMERVDWGRCIVLNDLSRVARITLNTLEENHDAND